METHVSVASVLLAVICTWTLSVACGTGAAPSQRTVENDGEVCLENRSGDSEAVEPGDLRARVIFNTCLSSTCDDVQSKNCTVELDGTTVVVESRADIVSQGGPCSADCGFASVTCDVPPLERGDYRVEHGDASTSFTLPSDESICVGESP